MIFWACVETCDKLQSYDILKDFGFYYMIFFLKDYIYYYYLKKIKINFL